MLGSAEHLPADQADSHPEAHSHVGWYLQALLGGCLKKGVALDHPTVAAALALSDWPSTPGDMCLSILPELLQCVC